MWGCRRRNQWEQPRGHEEHREPATVPVPYLTVLACLRTSRRILPVLPAAVSVKRKSWRGYPWWRGCASAQPRAASRLVLPASARSPPRYSQARRSVSCPHGEPALQRSPGSPAPTPSWEATGTGTERGWWGALPGGTHVAAEAAGWEEWLDVGTEASDVEQRPRWEALQGHQQSLLR